MDRPKLYVKDANGRYKPYVEPLSDYDNKLYRRVVRGNRVQYEPYSMHLSDDDLPEGVWVVVKHYGGRSIISGRYLLENYLCLKAGDIQDVSLSELGGLERITDVLARHWDELPVSYSTYDRARAIVALIFKYSDEIKGK